MPVPNPQPESSTIAATPAAPASPERTPTEEDGDRPDFGERASDSAA
jgi:hypothetical protein